MGQQKALLYIAQETYNIQYSVKKYNGKEYEKECACIHTYIYIYIHTYIYIYIYIYICN